VETTGDNLNIKFYDAQGKILYNESSIEKKNFHFAFTTEQDGNVNFCFQNNNQEIVSFRFKYATGVEAKDFSEMTTKKDI
jgi:hypothetical protein